MRGLITITLLIQISTLFNCFANSGYLLTNRRVLLEDQLKKPFPHGDKEAHIVSRTLNTVMAELELHKNIKKANELIVGIDLNLQNRAAYVNKKGRGEFHWHAASLMQVYQKMKLLENDGYL